MLKRRNYHTHTFRCKHAIGTVEDFLEAGVSQGIIEIGITDHTPFPDNRWLGVRMSMDELPDYVAEIEDARVKYDDVKILKGMECEYVAEYHSFFEDVLLGQYSFDYLIGAVHWASVKGDWVNCASLTSHDLRYFADYTIATMESGLFAFIAHPDIFGLSGLSWNSESIACSRDILSAASELNMPLEINGYGLRKESLIDADNVERQPYPLAEFWELASEYNITVVCNSDAHHPMDVLANIPEAMAIAEKNNLTLCDVSAFHA